ncbi:hypothetical protein Pcar_1345 [Syntrophotalea carbinolica DSM 2380]|uniref:DoxX family protein n=1 Tax=Syntrophotalea carbinolica (strain DSM 2380 / NBRC 103641 / GraBd1) TaxID=338963 RepID=Q3A4W3_SYNC1|nr:DoxX family protein [Syntrophotalea carbinolica]ABA88594.2 hypothetical protein Pcar_1345 [Syntrophotalea carbinolica DSM 2380]
MDQLKVICQLIIALGIFNVWVLRFGKETVWRGGTAKNMREEFEAYGLPFVFMITIGLLKIMLAILLIVGIWVPAVTRFAAFGLAILMSGAVGMHLKINDPIKKSLPAMSMLALSLIVALG